MLKPENADAPPAGSERRRSDRVLIATRITVIWKPEGGAQVSEPAETEAISAHGALLRSQTNPPMNSAVMLVNPRNDERSTARVASQGNKGTDGLWRFAVELSHPSTSFWGIYFPPGKEQPGVAQMPGGPAVDRGRGAR